MNIKEFIEALQELDVTAKAEVKLATSPADEFEVLSIYEDEEENVVWIDIQSV